MRVKTKAKKKKRREEKKKEKTDWRVNDFLDVPKDKIQQLTMKDERTNQCVVSNRILFSNLASKIISCHSVLQFCFALIRV